MSSRNPDRAGIYRNATKRIGGPLHKTWNFEIHLRMEALQKMTLLALWRVKKYQLLCWHTNVVVSSQKVDNKVNKHVTECIPQIAEVYFSCSKQPSLFITPMAYIFLCTCCRQITLEMSTFCGGFTLIITTLLTSIVSHRIRAYHLLEG